MQKLFGLILTFFFLQANSQDTARADADINSATIYYGYGAELTHQAKLKINPGTKFIVINKLSTTMDLNSLQVSCPEDVAILSQHYAVFYPVQPVPVKPKEVERLEDSIELVQRDISRSNNSVAIEQEVISRTGSLIEAALTNNGNKTVSSTDVLKLVEYYNDKIQKSKTNIFNLQQTIIQQQKRIADIKERIKNINDTNKTDTPNPYGQVILQVVCSKTEDIPIELSYYTNNAGWTPVYDIRVNSKTNKVKLVYKASLTQSTGIDWKKTKLTLSTGTPNFGVSAPVLNAWYLQLYVPEIYNSLQGRVPGLAVQNTIQSMTDDKRLSEVVVTGYGSQYKVEKKSSDSIDPSTLQQYTTLNEGQLNTNFEIDLPYNIESDGQLHSVTIKDEEINCLLKNYSVPKLDKEAYLLAEVSDWQNLDLLPGDASIIMDETYIGKSVIDPNVTADTLNLSLGKDKRVAVKRTLVKEQSSLKSSGGNNKQTFTYEITVKNNKLTDVNLLLKDQYPLSTIKEVEVRLEDGGTSSVNEETGVLTWKLNLKPGESQKLRFSYSVKYPKDKKIINLK